MPAKESLLQRFFRHSTVYVAASVLANFLAFLFNFIVVRGVTPAAYGEYYTAVAYVAILTTPMSVLSLWLTRQISSHSQSSRKQQVRQLNGRLLATLKRLTPALTVTIVGVSIWLWFGGHFLSGWTPPLILALTVLGLVVAWAQALVSGLQWFGALSILAVVSMSWRLGCGWGFLQFSGSLESLYWCLLAANGGQLLCYWFYLRRKFARQLAAPQQTILCWDDQWWLSLAAVAITSGLLNVDIIVVKIVGDPTFAGEYSLLSLFAKILLYASQPLINVAFTYFANANQTLMARKILRIASVLMIIFTVAMVGVYSLIPDLLITVVGTSEYLSLAGALPLAAVFGGLYSLAMLLVQFLVARNERRLLWGLAAIIGQIVGIIICHASSGAVISVNIWATLGLIVWLAWLVGSDRHHA